MKHASFSGGFYYLFFAHVVLLLYEFIISVVKLTALAVGVSKKIHEGWKIKMQELIFDTHAHYDDDAF